MPKQMQIDEARQLVAEQGTSIAQELFRRTYDPALAEAIAEKFDERADAFNQRQRKVREGLVQANLRKVWPSE